MRWIGLFILFSAVAQAVANELVRFEDIELQKSDLVRLDELLATPGLISSEIASDPILVLGIYAETESERARWAKAYLKRELVRAERELAFLKTYQRVFDTEYPDGGLLDLTAFKKPLAPTRLAVVVSLECDHCPSMVRNVQRAIQAGRVPGADVYVVGAQPLEIDGWAQGAGLSLELVQSGQLTLNMDEGLAAEFKITRFPTVLRRKGQSLVPLSITEMIRL